MTFDGSTIGALLDSAVSARAIHGIAAIVVSREGTLYHHAAGEAHDRTIFRNASLTKALATTAALQLVEQGQLGLDSPVDSVLPEFATIQVLDGFDGDKPRLRRPASRATVRQLMTHSSGLGYFFFNDKLARYHELTGHPSALSGLKESLFAPMVHDPGVAWEYGVSTDWLGLLVERVSGMSLGSFVRKYIYDPLGMVDSTFAPTPQQGDHLLRVMQRQPDGSLQPATLDVPPKLEWEAGGHGSYGTVQDYGRFVRAWLNDGIGILKPETAQMALQDQLGTIKLPETLRSQVPLLSNDVPSMPVRQSWGLGFRLTLESVPGMRSAGTADWAGIFNSYYWIDRRKGVGAVLMTQLVPFFDSRVIETLIGFERTVYQQFEQRPLQ